MSGAVVVRLGTQHSQALVPLQKPFSEYTVPEHLLVWHVPPTLEHLGLVIQAGECILLRISF